MARKMKDSGIQWIGEIPEDWEVSKLKYLGISKNETARYKKGERFVGLEHVSSFDGRVIGYDLDYEECETPLFEKGDFLFSKLRPYLAKGFLAEKSGFCTSELIRIKFNEGQCNKYFSYLLLSHKFIDMINGMTYGVKMPRISWQELREMILTMPPRWEQMRIADYLDDKCRSIDQTNAIIRDQMTTLGEYKKSVITEAVTKGLDKNVEMKDSGIEWIGEIPKHWNVMKLKYGLMEKMKYGASEEGVEFTETLPRYIRITDINQDGILKSTGKLSLPENKSLGYILEDNTVLFARSGATVGKTFLYKKEYGRSAYAGYLIAAKTNNTILLEKWLYYFTFSDAYYNWTSQMFSQSTIQNISAEKYSNMPLPITDISNQLTIVDYLDKATKSIDEAISIKQNQLSLLDEYKKSLIYEYVTGKREV